MAALSFTSAAHAAPGDLDPTFSSDGLQMTDFDRGPSGARAVARQSDGKLVTAGFGAGNFGLARHNLDGSLDASFSGDGKQSTDFGGADEAGGVVVQPDGKIIAVGGGGSGDFVVARYNPDGSLDTTFSGDGKQTTDFGGNFDRARGVSLQSDGRIVAVGGAGSAPFDYALARYNPDGSLDNTFSSDGKQTTDFGDSGGEGVAVQSDGKIVAVGRSGVLGPAAAGDFGVARYNPDGSLDTAFSGDGKQTTDFGGTFDGANDVVMQADGKIVVVGEGINDFATARYNSDGLLDATFSGDGKQTTNLANTSDTASSVALQGDGKIVVAGGTLTGLFPGGFALVRYNADGSLDTTFSGDGQQTTEFVGPIAAAASGVVVQGDGKIVAAGGGNGDFALARYNPDGSLDTMFSGDGKQTTEFPGNDRAQAIAVQADGKIVAVGRGEVDQGSFSLARYNPDGSLDLTFSSDGKHSTDFGVGNEVANGVVLQPDGKIVAVGHDGVAGFGLARYNSDGSLDTTFSGDGKQTTDIVPGTDVANGVVLQADGKIVAAGTAGGFGDFAVARYNPDGSLDATFDGDGRQTTDFSSLNDEANGVVLQADGKLVAVGGSGLSPSDFALARYNADGSLDTTFSGDGKQTTDFSGGLDDARGAVVQGDGRIVVAGSGNGDFALARYNADGSLDTTFSGDGQQTTDFSGSDDAFGVALQNDGKVVAIGSQSVFADFALARYTPDGFLDTTFSGDGKQTTDFAGGADRALGVALQGDGRIVAAGGATGETEDFAVARYEGGGAVADTTPPQTSITSGPGDGVTTGDSTPTFEFSSTEAGSSFSCRVDGGSPFSCASPVTTAALSDGQRSFSVAATDAAGNTDPTPASRTFTVQAPSQGQPQPPGEQPPGEQPPGVEPPASPFTPPVTNPVTTLTSVASVSFGTVAGATATVSPTGSVRLSRPLITCPSGPPACRLTAEATAQLPSATGSRADSAATRRTGIGRSSVSVAPGQAARVRFTLTRRGLAALTRQRRLRTTVTIVATRATRRTSQTITITLRAPRQSRR